MPGVVSMGPGSRGASVAVLVAVGVVCAAALVSCSRGGRASPQSISVGNSTVPARQLETAVPGLCRARSQAAHDPAAAGITFYDRAHAQLHLLAPALAQRDRRLAAALLEAKQKVEADLAVRPPRPELPADLTRLLGATRAGLARLSLPAPSC